MTSSRKTFLNDPLLLREYRPILSDEGNKTLNSSLRAIVASGVVDGLVYLALIPTCSLVINGGTVFSMGLGGWLVVLAVLAVIGAYTTYRMNLTAYTAALDALREVLIRVGDRIASLPLGWFTAGLNGRVSRIVTEGVMAIGSGVAHFTGPILRNMVTIVVLLLGMSLWQPALGATLAGMLLVVALCSWVGNCLTRKEQQVIGPADALLASRVVEYASCQAALRSAGRSGDYEPLNIALERGHKAHVKGLWLSTIALMFGGMAAQATVVSIIVVTAQLALVGRVDPVATLVFLGITLRFMRNVQDMVNFLTAAESSRTHLHLVDDILSAQPLETPDQPAELTQPGAVELQDVTFGYVPGVPVLQNISFRAEPGTMTAIVGPSGSGKTTVFKLLARFWDVDSGSVRVGGVDVRDQSTEQLMSQLSMVFQDVYLYDDTLLANIMVGSEDATREQALAAAHLAGCDEIADHLPDGWDTRVGEGGGRLSGGERQRVSVARALLKDAPVLLLDEATSALDPENEAHVQQSISALRQHATVLVIAHKLDTVREADRIIVLDEHGSIAQVGTHEELASQPGIYRHFLNVREASQGWSLV